MSTVDLPAKLVNRILLLCDGDHGKALAMMQKFTNIRRSSQDRARKIQKIRSEAEAAIIAVQKQFDCEHEFCESHGDPSGNGDSEEQCLICGEWIGQKAVRFT